MLKNNLCKRSIYSQAFLYSMLVSITACSQQPTNLSTAVKNNNAEHAVCAGSPKLPAVWADSFETAENKALLTTALGKPEQGKLCQGKVYQSKPNSDVTLFRAWNSTNPNSRFGKWWSLNKPVGNIAQYRKDYEICYQWSPIDKLIQCKLKPGAQVVVGNGQSAKCSKYLTYPVSEKLQVYVVNSAEVFDHCTEYNGSISWDG